MADQELIDAIENKAGMLSNSHVPVQGIDKITKWHFYQGRWYLIVILE